MAKLFALEEYSIEQINSFMREEQYPENYLEACKETRRYLEDKIADHAKGSAEFSHRDVDLCERLIISEDEESQKAGMMALRTIVEFLSPVGETNMYGSIGLYADNVDRDRVPEYQEYVSELECRVAALAKQYAQSAAEAPLGDSAITSLAEGSKILGDYYWDVQMEFMEAGFSSKTRVNFNMAQAISEQKRRREKREREIPSYDEFCRGYGNDGVKALTEKQVEEYIKALYYITPEEEEKMIRRALQCDEAEEDGVVFELWENALYVCKDNEDWKTQITERLGEFLWNANKECYGVTGYTIQAACSYAYTYEGELRKSSDRAKELGNVVQYLRQYLKQLIDHIGCDSSMQDFVKTYYERQLTELNGIYKDLKEILGGKNVKDHLPIQKKSLEAKVNTAKPVNTVKQPKVSQPVRKEEEKPLSDDELVDRFEKKLMDNPSGITAQDVERVRSCYAKQVKDKKYIGATGKKINDIFDKRCYAPELSVLFGDRVKRILLALLCLAVLAAIRLTQLKNVMDSEWILYVVQIIIVVISGFIGLSIVGCLGVFLGVIIGMIVGNIITPLVVFFHVPILCVAAVVLFLKGIRSNKACERKREKWMKKNGIPTMVEEVKKDIQSIQRGLNQVNASLPLDDIKAYYERAAETLEFYLI